MQRVCCGRRAWPIVLVVLLMSSGLLISGAGPAKRTRPFLIGVLSESWGPTPEVVGMRDGLLALGYREQEDFVIGVRFTQGDLAVLPAAAREFVQHGVDLLFASNEPPVKAAQLATSQIPIVFAGQVDPLRAGLIQSFARPGGNITGVANLPLELAPKRLQIFQEILPGLKRVLYVYDASDAQGVAEAQAYRASARHLQIELVEKPVQTQEEAQTTLTQVQKSEGDGILKPNSLSLNIPGFVLEATVQRGIPTMFDGAFWTEQGGLASYGPDFYEAGRQAARLVDKVLKGVKPGEIPVEMNHKIELVINLKTAEALGLTVAPAALMWADRLIR